MKSLSKFFWLGALATMSAALLVLLVPSRGESQSGPQITVLSTASLNGEVSPCG
jgi:hypothetical protein